MSQKVNSPSQHAEDLRIAKDALNGPLNDDLRIWRFAGVLESMAETSPQLAADLRKAADLATRNHATQAA